MSQYALISALRASTRSVVRHPPLSVWVVHIRFAEYCAAGSVSVVAALTLMRAQRYYTCVHSAHSSVCRVGGVQLKDASLLNIVALGQTISCCPRQRRPVGPNQSPFDGSGGVGGDTCCHFFVEIALRDRR